MPTVTRQGPADKAVARHAPTGNGPRPAGVLERIGPMAFGAGLKMLVWGASGSGKTTFAGTFPGKALWVVCSGGLFTGELRSLNTPEHRKKISQVVLEKGDELKEIAAHVAKTREFATVVLDHLSGYCDLVLGEVIGGPVPQQKNWGTIDQRDYGTMAQRVKESVRDLLNIDAHVLILAQERVDKPKEDVGPDWGDVLKPTVGAAVIPSIAIWLNPACDYVVQCFKRPRMVEKAYTFTGKDGKKETRTRLERGDGVEYCLRTEPHEVFVTKFRVPKGRPLPAVIVDPSYAKVAALLKEE